LNLGQGGGFRHHNGRWNPDPFGGICHGLGVVACGRGDDPGLLLLIAQPQRFAQGAAFFIGASHLQIFQLQIEPAVRHGTEFFRIG
jgi:hypothetical protein